MSDYNDKSQEGLVDYVEDVRRTFEGKEVEMARTDTGIKVDTDWIKIPSGESIVATYKGFDDAEAPDKFGNKKFYFIVDGEDKERYISSGSRSFLSGIQGKKIGQRLVIAKEGEMATTRYTITIIV